MCGIAGIIHKDPNKKVDPQLLVNMAAIQFHRGPDDFGYFSIDDRGIGMSHARLSIIDLHESGRQPFLSQDGDLLRKGDLLLAHNGEFYDYKRIRTDLTSRGAKFYTKSDSEIVMNLYPRKGFPNLMEDLRGEFAFSLYDRNQDKLILVRDRFGIKPLYYVETEDMIVYGSEIKVLFAHPEVPRRFDPANAYHQLMQTIVPGTTPFMGVKQVKPGHYVTIERENGRFKVQTAPYWDMPFPEKKDRDDSIDETVSIEAVREKLIEAVQFRLEADVPVGCYLSGGIDSCSILGLAAASRQDSVKAFTIGFDNDKYDESAIAVEMAKSTNADQDILRLEADHLYDWFETTHWHTERTIYNTLGVAKYLMSKHVHEAGYRVVVTGEGSDELFAGYPSFRKDMFEHGIDDTATQTALAEELMQSNELVRGSMLAPEDVHNPALEAMCGFTPSCLQTWLATAPAARDLLAKNIQEDLKGYDPGEAIAAAIDGSKLKNRHPLDIAQYVWIKTMLEGQILTWGGDRVDMANSMEARPAFLDHHLAERACMIPPAQRIKGSTEKYVLREAMKGVLPKVLYERQKFAFMAPPAHTDPNKLKALKDMAEKYLTATEIQAAGVLDKGAVEDLFRKYEHPDTAATDRVQLDALVNHVVGIQILHKQLIEQDVPALAAKQAEKLKWKVRATSAV